MPSWIGLLPQSLQVKLEGKHEVHKILINIGWLLADRLLRMAVGLVVGIWVARYLGPKDFGVFSYVLAFVSLLTPLATLGVDNLAVHDCVRQPEKKDEIIVTAFALRLISGVITMLATLYLIYAFSDRIQENFNLTIGLAFLLSLGLIFQAFDIFDVWFQAQVESKKTVIGKNINFLGINFLKIVFIKLRLTLTAFAIASLIESFSNAILSVVLYRKNGNHIKITKFSLNRMKVLLKNGLLLAFSGLAISIYMKVDQVMLGSMIGEESVGIYSVATKISEIWYFIPSILVTSYLPSTIKKKEFSLDAYYHSFQRLLNTVIWMAITISIIVSVTSKPLILLLFGINYIESAAVLKIHIWSCVFVFMGVISSAWVTSEGLFNKALMTTIGGAVINVILNFYLIPSYEALGASIATLISYALSSYLFNACIFKGYNIFAMQSKSFIFPISFLLKT